MNCCCCCRSVKVLKVGAYYSIECSFFFILLSRLLGHLRHTKHTRHHHGETTLHLRLLLLAGLLSARGLLLSLHHVHLHKGLMILGQSLLLHHDNLLVVLGHLLRASWDLRDGGLTLRHLHHLREHRHLRHLTLSTSCGHTRHHHGETSHLGHLHLVGLSLCRCARFSGKNSFFLCDSSGSVFLVLVLFVLLLRFYSGW